MAYCIWNTLKAGGVCVNCSQNPLKRDYDEAPIRECRPPGWAETPRETSQVLLGDRIEQYLTSLGVTKERVSDALEACGMPPCDCDGRQEAINDWDRMVRSWWSRVAS